MKTGLVRNLTLHCVIIALGLGVIGCSTVPESEESKDVLAAKVRGAIVDFKAEDPGIQAFFDKSYGYAVVPRIVKGGFWVGAAYGKGEVFEQGAKVGYCDMSQATLGFTFGGQYFREIIFFREAPDLDKFRTGEFTFSAQATAVAVTAGAAAKADYKDGMAIFIIADKGLMIDASLGGQKFAYVPIGIAKAAE